MQRTSKGQRPEDDKVERPV